MKNIFKKGFGIALMSTPVLTLFWFVGRLFNQGVLAGAVMVLAEVLIIIGVLCGFGLLFIVSQIGWKLYNGASFRDLMAKDEE